MDGPTVRILVASHKPYRMPEDPMYLPLCVGAALGHQIVPCGADPESRCARDDTGDNISELNASFCELTGLYWAWKNLPADYLGLAHYRRYLGLKRTRDPLDGILTRGQLMRLLAGKTILVPKKRRYYIETLYSHYAHTHEEEHLKICREILAEKNPKFLPAFDRVMRRRWGYMFNLMILRRDLADDYCSWLFPILFSLYERVDRTGMSEFDLRFCGRIGEILFNVWLECRLEDGTVRDGEIRELPCICTEKTDWPKKLLAFFKAKFGGVRYEGS